jgi:uncharacterized membrane protein YfcA
MLKYFALPVVGFLIGLLVVMLGGGGGIAYVGILTAFFNIPAAIAVSTSLATIIPTTGAGAFSHWKAGNLNLRLGFIMLIGGVFGSVVGSLCSSLVPQNIYNKLTGVIMLLLCAQMFISYLRKKRKKDHEKEQPERKFISSVTVKAISFGVLGGLMSGLIGLSGGTSIVAGLVILGCNSLETIGTSAFVLFGISITGFIMHLGLGSVDWKLVGFLIIGTSSGAFVGPLLLKHLDKAKTEKFLQPSLFIMIIVMGILLLFK